MWLTLSCLYFIEIIIESQNGFGEKGIKDNLVPAHLPWAETSSTKPGCPEPCPAWPWALPGKGHPQLLLRNVFQSPMTPTRKNFFITSNLNLLSFSLNLFYLLVTDPMCGTWESHLNRLQYGIGLETTHLHFVSGGGSDLFLNTSGKINIINLGKNEVGLPDS